MADDPKVKKLYVHSGDTYDIEADSLEAHVAICSERYGALHQHIDDSETRLTEKIDNNSNQITRLERVFFWGIGAVFITLLGAMLSTIFK
jgi:hypothetical protein